VRCPAAIPAIALGAGITAGIFVPLPIPPLAVLLAWTAAVAAFVLRDQRSAVAIVACGFLLAGAALGRSADHSARDTSLGAFFQKHCPAGEHQLFVRAEGVLRSDASMGASGVTLDLRIDRVALDGAVYPVSGGALIGVGGALGGDQISQWRAGRRIAFPATLRRPSRYFDAGVPDFERQLAWRGAVLVGAVKSDRLVEIVSYGTGVSEALAAGRASIRNVVARHVAPWSHRSAAVVLAILIGDRAGLGDEDQRRLQEAGTYHVIAISGGNIAILAGLCTFFLRGARVRASVSGTVVIAMLAIYALAVEGGSSVRRATLVAAIYLAARVWDQTTLPLNAGAVAASVLFCLDPLEVVDAGFALTFGATVGILVGLSRTATRLPKRSWLQGPAALLATSVFAEIALLAIGAFVFSRVTFAGLVANFAAIPLMTVVQIAGMATVAAAWGGGHEIAHGFGGIAHLGVEGLVGSAAIVDIVPWLTRRVAPPPLIVIALYYASLISLVVPACPALITIRRLARVTAIASGCWIIASPTVNLALDERPLRITYLDVGQGDAAVVQFPNGRTLSIDAGGNGAASFDIGARVIAPAFWALGIRRLDYMSISHADVDHIGGALSLFRDFNPRELWEGAPVPPHQPTRELRMAADRAGAVWRTVRSTDRAQFGNVAVIVHHPPPPEWERQKVRNDDSEVIEIQYGGVSFVFTGDISREVERTIAPGFARAPIRILKVPHHGSATSSSSEFLNALQPDVAVISAGRGNPFGHPVASVLDRYREVGAAIYRTDRDGAVTVETDGTVVHVRTFMNRRLTLTTHGR
jgi:competence protein ComEC